MLFRTVSMVSVLLVIFFGHGFAAFAADESRAPPPGTPCKNGEIAYAADFFFQQNQTDIVLSDILRMRDLFDHRSPYFKGWRAVVVAGYADSKEQDKLALSTQRALAVKNLVEQFGVAPTVIKAVGYGDTLPMGSIDVANQRVEVELKGLCGLPD